jgi:hypothetical protein
MCGEVSEATRATIMQQHAMSGPEPAEHITHQPSMNSAAPVAKPVGSNRWGVKCIEDMGGG